MLVDVLLGGAGLLIVDGVVEIFVGRLPKVLQRGRSMAAMRWEGMAGVAYGGFLLSGVLVWLSATQIRAVIALPFVLLALALGLTLRIVTMK